MSNLEIELKNRHCGACRRTIDLRYVSGREACCPVCGRGFLVEASSILRASHIRSGGTGRKAG